MYLCGWSISFRGIDRPIVSFSALIWFIRYLCYYQNLQFLNNIIIVKLRLISLIPRRHLVDFDNSIPVFANWFCYSQMFYNDFTSNLSTLSIHEEGSSRYLAQALIYVFTDTNWIRIIRVHSKVWLHFEYKKKHMQFK